jgi:predicted hydrolase (HD superfamily)
MDRFTAYLLVRRFLKRPDSRNRALATEAIMEELATTLGPAAGTAEAAGLGGPAPESWGVLGLLSQLDLEYAEHNPDARGVTAREQAVLEGMDPALATMLASWSEPGPSAPPVQQALLLADELAGAALARADGDLSGLGRELELRRGGGDPTGERLDQALTALSLDGEQAATLAARALEKVAAELRRPGSER